MIIDVDSIIDAEMLFEQQEIVDDSGAGFKKLLLAIVAIFREGGTLKDAKQIIRDSNINEDLRKNLKGMIGEQLENITDEKQSIDFDEAVIAGLTFNELIAERKKNTQKQAQKFMARIEDAIKAGEADISQEVQNELKKYEKSIETFYRTQTKSAREFGYAENERKESKEIIGWISIAVLDNKTSSTCMALHNKFYKKSATYKTRFDLPYQIPRHPNCRSMFVPVFRGKSLQYYKGKNLETFLQNNEGAGKELLGIKKYELFKQKKIKLTNFVDLKGGRFYTNAQIKKRLNIKG